MYMENRSIFGATLFLSGIDEVTSEVAMNFAGGPMVARFRCLWVRIDIN